jgi:hypothetical protein
VAAGAEPPLSGYQEDHPGHHSSCLTPFADSSRIHRNYINEEVETSDLQLGQDLHGKNLWVVTRYGIHHERNRIPHGLWKVDPLSWSLLITSVPLSVLPLSFELNAVLHSYPTLSFGEDGPISTNRDCFRASVSSPTLMSTDRLMPTVAALVHSMLYVRMLLYDLSRQRHRQTLPWITWNAVPAP